MRRASLTRSGCELHDFRGLESAQAALGSANSIVSTHGHLAILMHEKRALLVLDQTLTLADCSIPGGISFLELPMNNESVARLLYRSFESPIASVRFLHENGELRLAVVTRSALVHWHRWLPEKMLWDDSLPSVSLRNARSERVGDGSLSSVVAACIDPSSSGGLPAWLCIENDGVLNELVLMRRQNGGTAVTVARVPGNEDSDLRLWATLDGHVWLQSSYGGLTCINVAKGVVAPPIFFTEGDLTAQHPRTGQLVLLEAGLKSSLWLLQPFQMRKRLCWLTGLQAPSSMAFSHELVFILDQRGSRCFLFDIQSGANLNSFSTPNGFEFAQCGAVGRVCPPVLMWGPESRSLEIVPHEAIETLQGQLSPTRGAAIAEDWGLSRLAAWRILSEGGAAPESMMRFTGTPALSVALAGTSGATEELVRLTVAHLESQSKEQAFQSYSEMTPLMGPLLKKWSTAELEQVEEYEMSKQETMEIRAMQEPETLLDELLDEKSGSDEMWLFCLTCRLLFQLRPAKLEAFIESAHLADCDNLFLLAADCLSLAAPEKLSSDQVASGAQILMRADNDSASARLLIASGVPQTINFRLAFAEALRKGDEETMIKLWGDCDLDIASLLRMIQVYGDEEQQSQTNVPISVGLMKRLLQSQKARQS